MLNFKFSKRQEILRQRQQRAEHRMRTGKTVKMNPTEREKLRV